MRASGDGALPGETSPLLSEASAGKAIRARVAGEDDIAHRSFNKRPGLFALGAVAVCGVLALMHGTSPFAPWIGRDVLDVPTALLARSRAPNAPSRDSTARVPSGCYRCFFLARLVFFVASSTPRPRRRLTTLTSRPPSVSHRRPRVALRRERPQHAAW